MAVRREVLATVQELFTDPDAGLELSTFAKKRLRLAQSGKSKRISLADVKRRYY
ncbi:MAG: hypothetical protein Q7R88_03140 [bacterium]|nr:hypothetical protein [bacterium]